MSSLSLPSPEQIFAEALPPEQVLDYFGGDRESAVEILQMTLQDVAAKWQTALDFAKSQNWHQLARTLHTLRGAIATFGYSSLLTLLQKLEDVCEMGHPVSIEEFTPSIQTLLASLQQTAESLQKLPPT